MIADRNNLLPKYNLLDNIPTVQSSTSAAAADVQVATRVAVRQAGGNSPVEFLQMIGTTHALYFSPTRDKPVIHKLKPGPRAWVVYHWDCLPPLKTSTHEELAEHTRRVLLDGDKLRDFREFPIIETNDLPPQSPLGLEGGRFVRM